MPRNTGPVISALRTPASAANLPALEGRPQTVLGDQCNVLACEREDVDIVVIAVGGMQGIFPLIAALEQGKKVALANKESIVCGGELLGPLLNRNRANLFPVDSEHSAVFQCLQGLGSASEVHA